MNMQNAPRLLGRSLARKLTAAELELVAGGTSKTGEKQEERTSTLSCSTKFDDVISNCPILQGDDYR